MQNARVCLRLPSLPPSARLPLERLTLSLSIPLSFSSIDHPCLCHHLRGRRRLRAEAEELPPSILPAKFVAPTGSHVTINGVLPLVGRARNNPLARFSVSPSCATPPSRFLLLLLLLLLQHPVLFPPRRASAPTSPCVLPFLFPSARRFAAYPRGGLIP